MSDESTACELPSVSTARTRTIGNPISRPFSIAERKPLSQAGMYSVGIEPP
jgi:hypothetical protein